MDISSDAIINSAFDKQEFFEVDLGTLTRVRYLKDGEGQYLNIMPDPQDNHEETWVGLPIVVVNSDTPVLRRVIVIEGIRFEKDIFRGEER